MEPEIRRERANWSPASSSEPLYFRKGPSSNGPLRRPGNIGARGVNGSPGVSKLAISVKVASNFDLKTYDIQPLRDLTNRLTNRFQLDFHVCSLPPFLILGPIDIGIGLLYDAQASVWF